MGRASAKGLPLCVWELTGDNQFAVIDPKTLEVTGRISTGNGPDGMAWIPGK